MEEFKQRLLKRKDVPILQSSKAEPPERQKPSQGDGLKKSTSCCKQSKQEDQERASPHSKYGREMKNKLNKQSRDTQVQAAIVKKIQDRIQQFQKDKEHEKEQISKKAKMERALTHQMLQAAVKRGLEQKILQKYDEQLLAIKKQEYDDFIRLPPEEMLEYIEKKEEKQRRSKSEQQRYSRPLVQENQGNGIDEDMEIPAQFQDSMIELTKKIVFKIIEEMKARQVDLKSFHGTQTKFQIDELFNPEIGKDQTDPEQETVEIQREQRRRAAMLAGITRAIEETCFTFMQKVIDGDMDMLVPGVDQRQRRLNAEYSQRVLKKIVFHRSQEESFFEETKEWVELMEIYRLKEDKKALRQKQLEQRRKRHLEGQNFMDSLSIHDSSSSSQESLQDTKNNAQKQIFSNIAQEIQNQVKKANKRRRAEQRNFNLGIKSELKRKAKVFRDSQGKVICCESSDEETPEEQIKLLEYQLDCAQKIISQMRIDFTKEIVNMQTQLRMSKQVGDKDFKFIDVKYFDATDILNDDIRKLLNYKIEEMRNRYEMKLVDKDEQFIKISAQIALFRALEADGNVGISFDEMNADDMIRKLSIIEDNPLKIWDAFNKHYRKGFFNYPIEKEFGITPDNHKKLIAKFDQKIQKFKDQSDIQLDRLSQKFDQERAIYRDQLRGKEKDILDLKESFRLERIKIQANQEETFQFRLDKELARYYKVNIDEKQYLQNKLEKIKQRTANFTEQKTQIVLKMFWIKWYYLTKLKQFRDDLAAAADDEGRQKIMFQSIITERKFFKNELEYVQKHSGPYIEQLKSEIQYLKDEHQSLFEKYSKIELKFYFSDKMIDTLKKEREKYRLQAQTLSEQLSTLKSQHKLTESEVQDLKLSVEQNDGLITHLQNENDTLKSKIVNLNKIADKYNQKTEIVDNSLQYAFKNSLAELRHQKQAINDTLNNFIKEDYFEKGTMTEIQDLEREIWVQEQTMAQKYLLQTNLQGILLQNQVTQTHIDKEDQLIQTDFKIEREKSASREKPASAQKFKHAKTMKKSNSKQRKKPVAMRKGKTQLLSDKIKFTDDSDGSGTQLRHSRQRSEEDSFEDCFSDNQMNIRIVKNQSFVEPKQNADVEVVMENHTQPLVEESAVVIDQIKSKSCVCQLHGCSEGQKSREREKKLQLMENQRLRNSYKRFTVKCMENLLNKKFVEKREQGMQTDLDYMTEWINPVYVADQELFDQLDQNFMQEDDPSSQLEPPSNHSGPTSKTGTARTNSVIRKADTKQSSQQLNQDLIPDNVSAVIDVQSFDGIFPDQPQSRQINLDHKNNARKIITDPSKDFLDAPLWMLRNQSVDQTRNQNQRYQDSALSKQELENLIEKKKYNNLTEHLKMINNSRNHINQRVRTQISQNSRDYMKKFEILNALKLKNVDLKINPKYDLVSKGSKQVIRGGQLVNVQKQINQKSSKELLSQTRNKKEHSRSKQPIKIEVIKLQKKQNLNVMTESDLADMIGPQDTQSNSKIFGSQLESIMKDSIEGEWVNDNGQTLKQFQKSVNSISSKRPQINVNAQQPINDKEYQKQVKAHYASQQAESQFKQNKMLPVTSKNKLLLKQKALQRRSSQVFKKPAPTQNEKNVNSGLLKSASNLTKRHAHSKSSFSRTSIQFASQMQNLISPVSQVGPNNNFVMMPESLNQTNLFSPFNQQQLAGFNKTGRAQRSFNFQQQ